MLANWVIDAVQCVLFTGDTSVVVKVFDRKLPLDISDEQIFPIATKHMILFLSVNCVDTDLFT